MRKPAASFDLAFVAEAVGQAAAIVVVLWVMFGSRLGSRQLFYLSFVPIIWIAMRQGIRRAVSGLLALNFGIVVAMHLFPPVGRRSLQGQPLMLVVSGVGLIVGSAVSERHRIALDLQEQTAHLNSLIENSPFGIVVLDQQGRVELTNAAFDRLFAFDHARTYRQRSEPHIRARCCPRSPHPSIEKVLAGETLHTTARRRRKDGHILDLEVHAVPLEVDGRVRGSYTIYKDISEQIRASEAERKHAEVLEPAGNRVTAADQADDAVERDGRLARVSAGPPMKPAQWWPSRCRSFLPEVAFRHPILVQVVAEPGGGGGAVGRRQRL